MALLPMVSDIQHTRVSLCAILNWPVYEEWIRQSLSFSLLKFLGALVVILKFYSICRSNFSQTELQTEYPQVGRQILRLNELMSSPA